VTPADSLVSVVSDAVGRTVRRGSARFARLTADSNDRVDGRFALGDSAGLVEDDVIDLLKDLEGVTGTH